MGFGTPSDPLFIDLKYTKTFQKKTKKVWTHFLNIFFANIKFWEIKNRDFEQNWKRQAQGNDEHPSTKYWRS